MTVQAVSGFTPMYPYIGSVDLAQWIKETLGIEIEKEVAGPEELASIVAEFPQTIARARRDWGRFNAGYEAGLFTQAEIDAIIEWYSQLPHLWDGIKPNWQLTPEQEVFYSDTEAWITKLRTDPWILFPGLGFAWLIVAGVVIALSFGVAGAFWAVGYMKEQSNISRIINGVVAGQIPADVLQAAMDKETEPGPLDKIAGLVQAVAIAAGAIFAFSTVGPAIKKVFG